MQDLILLLFNLMIAIFFWLLLLYFVYTVGYSILLSIASFFYKLPSKSKDSSFKKIVVLIPAYKEDGVIISAAKNAVSHIYPPSKFDVVVIADSLQPGTLKQLYSVSDLLIEEVKFEESTKVKALNQAIKNLRNSYEIAVILDADNVMKEDFLLQINSCFNESNRAVQGQRVAKNTDSSMAILDGVSEAINNQIYREGTSALGLSCSFIGSGMAIDFDLLKNTLIEMHSVGGFDRDLEVRLIAKGYKVSYLKNAIVFDEKVEDTKVFANQRKRWIYSQYFYLFKEFSPGIKQLAKGNLVYFNSAVLRNVQLPRLINIGLLFVLSVLSLIVPITTFFPFQVWASLLFLIVLSNVIAIPRAYFTKDLGVAILSLPKIFIIMFLLLFKLKGSNKKFIHTPHKKTRV